jgi:hypothetical protein
MRSPASPDWSRFVTHNFHLLKGLCYLPAGLLLLAGTLAVRFARPAWLEGPMGGLILIGAALAAAAPFAYWMHRRYRAAFGRVSMSGSEGDVGSPMGALDLPMLGWFVYMFGFLFWIVMAVFYIPDATGAKSGSYMLLAVAAMPMARGALGVPSLAGRGIYTAAVLLLAASTMTPLLGWSLVAAHTAMHATLGAVVAGLGLYNHQVLTRVLGPLDAAGTAEAAPEG